MGVSGVPRPKVPDRREAFRIGRALGDLLHDTDYNDHPALLKAFELGIAKGAGSALSGADLVVHYPQENKGDDRPE